VKDASVVVVVAGGGARRFGADKLAAPIGGQDSPGGTVLDAVVQSLPVTRRARFTAPAKTRPARDRPPRSSPD
jgi:molybdopterin-guanine dinucleotide biosynthesis protein A